MPAGSVEKRALIVACTEAQVGAVAPGVVGLVGPDPVRALARPTEPQPGNPHRFQHGLELRGIAPLSCRDHNG